MEYISTNDDLIIKGKLFLEALGLNENDVASCLLKLQSDVANASNMININYADLVVLRDNGSLIPGRQYRIIDYETTTTQAAKEYEYDDYHCYISNTRSAGHQFDIIVTADSANKLNENAKAIQREGDDTYFNNSNLAAWEIKYCLDNDINRFGWADVDNGTGVIYYMKDEFGNECSYDFKNIQFQRKLDEKGLYVPENGSTNDSSDEPILEWCYTFGGHLYDSSLSINEDFKTFKNNVIGSFNFDNKFWLPDNVFLNSNDGTLESYYNILHDNCICNTFSYNNAYNELGMYCRNNIFNRNCYSNILKNDCCDNVFDFNCLYNVFDDSCRENRFGSNCSNNSFRYKCSNNQFLGSCGSNTFGNDCSYNTLGITCNHSTFGNACSDNNFGSFCYHNTFGNACSDNNFGGSCNYNTFGNICSNNTFGYGCTYNTLGVNCSDNTFGGNCNSNRFGNSCEYNNFGECCWGNILEENCKYIKIITKFTVGNADIVIYHKNITVGQGNEYMMLQVKCTSTDRNKSFQNVRIAPGCCSGQRVDGEMDYIDILDGLGFTITNPDTGLSFVSDIKYMKNQPFSTLIGKTTVRFDDDGKPISDYILTARMGV